MTDELDAGQEGPASQKEKTRRVSFLDKIKNSFKKPSLSELGGDGDDVTDTETLWNTVGYHRVSGGIFYSYILLIVGAIAGLATVGIIAEFLPYPEINGYKSLVGSILGFWFGLLDLNLGGGGSLSDSMARFIGQYADTNPRRSMEYIRFYIWFQMFSGIAQITVIAIVMFGYFVNTDLAYLTWFILAQSLVQYPGMLMIMEDTLKAFQRGDKTAWLSWLQDTVFQLSVDITFLIIGKAWGASDPRIGELMGITVMYTLSKFVDDWINLAVGARMFSGVMKKRGINHGFALLFIPKFDKGIVKEVSMFVGKQWIGNQILGVFGYFLGLYIISETPQMASWQGLLLIPNFFGHLVSMVNWGSPTVPAISESYNNGKKELAQYFIADMHKYWMFVSPLFMGVPLAILAGPILNAVLATGLLETGLANYQAGLIMIPIIMLKDVTGQWRGWWSKIFVACNRPMPPVYLNYIFTPSGYVFQFLFLYMCVWNDYWPVWFILFMPGFLNDTFKAIVGYAWLNWKVIKIPYKKMAWQVLGAPALTAVAYALTLLLYSVTIMPLLDALFSSFLGDLGPAATAIFTLLAILFLFPAVLMSPYYALFGGWDSFTLEELRKAAIISGPSKGIMMLLYRINAFFARLSPLHDRFPMADYDLVRKQVEELVAEGKANLILGRNR